MGLRSARIVACTIVVSSLNLPFSRTRKLFPIESRSLQSVLDFEIVWLDKIQTLHLSTNVILLSIRPLAEHDRVAQEITFFAFKNCTRKRFAAWLTSLDASWIRRRVSSKQTAGDSKRRSGCSWPEFRQRWSWSHKCSTFFSLPQRLFQINCF